MKFPDYRKSEPQQYVDHWRGGAVRVLEYVGPCVGCSSRVYSFVDGENDPRGVLDERHAHCPLEEDGMEFPACFLCMNDEPRYRYAMERARVLVRRERIRKLRLELAGQVRQREEPQ